MEKTKYRIIEKEFEDGHKTYMAQEAIKFLGITIGWKKYVLRVDDYGYGSISYICCGKTYDDCLQQLKKNLEEKERARLKSTVKSIRHYEARV